MTTLARRLVMTAVVLGWVHAASAQTVDEIIEKHLAAMGGRAALGKLTSRTMAGTISVSVPGGEAAGAIEVMNQAPNKSRSLITLDLSALGVGKMVVDQRFDGVNGYVLDTLQGNRDITGDQLEGMRNGVFPTPFLNYKELGMTIDLGGKEKVGDRDAYVLNVKSKTGPLTKAYIDAESFLQIRQVVKANVPPVGDIEQTTDLLDQRDVDGVKVPFQIKATSSVQSFTVTLTKVEHNKPIDPSLFSKPAQ